MQDDVIPERQGRYPRGLACLSLGSRGKLLTPGESADQCKSGVKTSAHKTGNMYITHLLVM
jgi:hypothetical protein